MTRYCLAPLVALALALGGCGGDDEKKPSKPTGEKTTATTQTTQEKKSDADEVKLTEIGSFEAPVYLASEPGNPKRLFVVEQPGRIKVVENGETTEEPFLDITDEVGSGGERGLLSVALAPDYAKSRKFYVYFTDKQGNIRIREYRRSADSPALADKASGRDVLEIDHSQFENHNGGQLQFGPDDLLYIGTGDGGGAGNTLKTAQDKDSLLGKLLRIDPSKPESGKPYAIPEDNPFAGEQGARPEIYSLGLRNPFRFSFDKKTGDLAIGDVGQDTYEEVDYVKRGDGRGANFGWSAFEARERFDDSEAPNAVHPVIVRRTRGEGGDCSVIGGYVVRDPKLGGLDGQYVFGDYCNPTVRIAKLEIPDAKDDRALGIEVPQLSSFGQAADGTLYAVSNNGPVFRLDPK